MRKRMTTTWSGLLLAIMTVMLVSSCAKVPKYAKLIPDDSPLVVKLDVKSAAKDCADTDKDQLKHNLKKALKRTNMSNRMINALVGAVDEPQSLGLDLRDPVFLFVDSDGKVSLVGAVYDKDNLTDLLNLIAKEDDVDKVREKKDYNTFVDGKVVVVFNKDWFYLSEKKYNQEEGKVIDDMKEAFEQKETDGTMLDNKYMADMCDADGFLQVLFIPDNMRKSSQLKDITRWLPDNLGLDDVACLYSLNTGRGEASLTCQLLTDNEEWKQFIANTDNNLKEFSQKQLQYTSKDGLNVLFSCDLPKILALGDFESVVRRSAENDRKLLKSLTESLVGEAVFCMTDYDFENGYPELAIYAGTSKRSIIDFFESEKPSKWEEEDVHQFSMPLAYDKIVDWQYGSVPNLFKPIAYSKLGYKNKYIYLVTGSNPKPFEAQDKPLTFAEAKGRGFYAYVSGSFMTKIIAEKLANRNMQKIQPLCKAMDYAEIYYEGAGKSVFRIRNVNTDSSILSQWILALLEYSAKDDDQFDTTTEDVAFEDPIDPAFSVDY